MVKSKSSSTLNEKTLKRIKREVSEIALLMSSMLRHIGEDANHEATLAMIQAAAEKAGYLADRATIALGSSPVYGDFNAWAHLDDAAPAQEVAQS